MPIIKIRELRKEKGWSASVLAKKLVKPVNQRTVYRWERGECFPNTNTLVELADIFELPVNKLFYEDVDSR